MMNESASLTFLIWLFISTCAFDTLYLVLSLPEDRRRILMIVLAAIFIIAIFYLFGESRSHDPLGMLGPVIITAGLLSIVGLSICLIATMRAIIAVMDFNHYDTFSMHAFGVFIFHVTPLFLAFINLFLVVQLNV
jgi:hypothetical protein